MTTPRLGAASPFVSASSTDGFAFNLKRSNAICQAELGAKAFHAARSAGHLVCADDYGCRVTPNSSRANVIRHVAAASPRPMPGSAATRAVSAWSA